MSGMLGPAARPKGKKRLDPAFRAADVSAIVFVNTNAKTHLVGNETLVPTKVEIRHDSVVHDSQASLQISAEVRAMLITYACLHEVRDDSIETKSFAQWVYDKVFPLGASASPPSIDLSLISVLQCATMAPAHKVQQTPYFFHLRISMLTYR